MKNVCYEFNDIPLTFALDIISICCRLCYNSQ